MNKIFKFLSMLLLVNSNAQDIQTTAETSDVIIEKYKDNYIQLSREDQISKTFQFDEGEIVNYPDMEYRMYSYNLFSMPGTCEDATPYMFPFDKHLITNDHGTYALNYQTSSGETWYSTLYYTHCKENYHFYNIESNTIDFYVDISSFYRTSLQNNYPLEEMLNYYTEQNIDDIVFETKNKLYYEQLAPLIKDIFNNNTNILLNNLGVGNNSKNYHIIASLEETLLIEIKQSILGKSYNDIDTLLDEE